MVVVQELKKLGFEGWDAVTTKNFAERLMTVMPTHKGRKNAASKEELAMEMFGFPLSKLKPLNRVLVGDFITKAMMMLRDKSNCFIVGATIEGTRRYFVVTDDTEAGMYHNQADNRINGLRSLKKRADKAVNQGWHKQVFGWDKDRA